MMRDHKSHSSAAHPESVTLSQARAIIECLAAEQSVLLLSPPGIGKSDTVVQAAEAAGLPCKSLLGTQIAPEDVSGIPRIVGERSVFCPPRILLPEDPEPFCLFLDELPACTPDIQKAFYSILLERRLGEHPLPTGTWVVAAGNRAEDRALVRSLSSALINRVVILNVRVDFVEWLQWAQQNGVRSEILSFITFMPDALMRPVPNTPVPFSTPRSWAAFSRALDLIEAKGIFDQATRRALAFGRLTAEDAAIFCAMADAGLNHIPITLDCLKDPTLIPTPVLGRRRSSVFNPAMDVIFPSQERIILSDQPEHKRVSSQPVRDAMRQSLALKSIAKQVSNFSFPRFNSSVRNTQFVNALRSQYQPPWQAALQRWMEAVAPGQRTYTRPSRRGADRSDCVLPGRSREGWTLHIVLDTSESMSNELPKCLSAIADFCEGVGVSDVHLLQCDSKVTVDEWVSVEELDQYQITGSGGSNMCPAMLKLAADPETTAIVVITDGEILYPHEFSVCEVLWVLTQPDGLSLNEFSPSYGTIVKLG